MYVVKNERRAKGIINTKKLGRIFNTLLNLCKMYFIYSNLILIIKTIQYQIIQFY